MTITEETTDPSCRAVAPAWHTAIVVVALLGISIAGAVTKGMPGVNGYGRLRGYVLVMAIEWATVWFIWYGVSRRGTRLSELVGGGWAGPLAVFRDIGIAVGFLLAASIVLNGLARLLRAVANQAIRNLLPQSTAEMIVYLLMALTAGFCEELIFRGYLQRQFTALTKAPAGGIVLQGIAFGASHGYQGWKYMVIISVFGIMFGALAYWRRSLRPGMVAHFLQDGVGGILAGHLH